MGGAFLFIFCTQLGEGWPGGLSPLWLLIKFIQLEVVRPGLDSSQAAPVCTDSGKTGDPLPPSMKNQESFHGALRSTISDSHEMNWILFLCRVCVCVCVCVGRAWGEVRCKDTEAGTVKSTHDEFTWAKRFSGYLIYSLEGLMLKLKLQYFGHLMWRTDSLKKMLMLGKTEGRRRGNKGWDDWMASPTQWTGVWASSGRRWRMGKPGTLSSTRLNNWTTTNNFQLIHRTLFSLGERHAVNLLEQQWVLEAAITYNQRQLSVQTQALLLVLEHR